MCILLEVFHHDRLHSRLHWLRSSPERHLLQDSKYALPDGTLSRCSNVCQLEYVLQQRQQQEVCEIKYIGLGAGMACIAATSNRSRVVTLNVSLTHHLQARQQQGNTGQLMQRL